MTDTDTTALRELLAKSDTMLTTLQVVLADAAPALLDELEALRAENERLRDHLLLAADELDVYSPDKLLCAAIRSVATTTATDQARAALGGGS